MKLLSGTEEKEKVGGSTNSHRHNANSLCLKPKMQDKKWNEKGDGRVYDFARVLFSFHFECVSKAKA